VPTNPNPQRIAEVPIPPPDVSSVPSAAIKPPGTDLIPVGSVEIIPDPYPSIRSSSDSKTPILRPGASLVFGRVISKVQPMYPREALQQRIAGPVKLHVVVARDGSVGKLQVMEGPAILAEEARRTVQQWRYEPTRLNGQAIETEENVIIVFRLNGLATPAK
jgi:protein TonB